MEGEMTEFIVSENMIMWAFRYALGRRTGAVSDVADNLKMNWDKLEQFTRDQIKKEIQIAIDKREAGDDCDIKRWEEILKK